MKGERRVELVDGTGAVGVRYRYRRGSDGMAPTLSYLKITKMIDFRVHFRCEYSIIAAELRHGYTGFLKYL